MVGLKAGVFNLYIMSSYSRGRGCLYVLSFWGPGGGGLSVVSFWGGGLFLSFFLFWGVLFLNVFSFGGGGGKTGLFRCFLGCNPFFLALVPDTFMAVRVGECRAFNCEIHFQF